MGRLAGISNHAAAIDTPLHRRQSDFMKAASPWLPWGALDGLRCPSLGAAEARKDQQRCLELAGRSDAEVCELPDRR